MHSIRERTVAGLKVGDLFTASRTFTQEDLVAFARLSRDYNPVHFDARFAKTKNFPEPVCHGLLTGSLITEIGGQIGWLASAMSFRFKRPVFVGDTVTCTLVIDEMDERGRARASATFANQDGTTVLEAELRGIVPGDEERAVLGEMLAEGDPTNGLSTWHEPQS